MSSFKFIDKALFPLSFCVFIFFSLLARIIVPKSRFNLVWGSTPILNYSYWSKSVSKLYNSKTFTYDFYRNINTRDNWDLILTEKYKIIPLQLRKYIAFIHSLFLFDVFFISCDGFFIGNTSLSKFQHLFLKYLIKTVVLTYGSDAYVYSRIRSSSLLTGLLFSYNSFSREQLLIKRNVDYWVKYADVFIPGVMLMDGIGRSDVLIPSTLFIDTKKWKSKKIYNNSDGVNGYVNIAHSPNHRGFKGTEFIIKAIEKLKSKGLKVNLLLLENIKNSSVQEILNKKADILVEQLIFTGHGLSAIEGMASGLPTISNLENSEYILPFKRYTYFSECPLISSSPEDIEECLELLITNPSLREKKGKLGVDYVKKSQFRFFILFI